LSQTAQTRLDRVKRIPSDLAGILAPLDAETFLRRDYGKTFVHVPGTSGKFSALLPWPVLNEILEQHRLEPPRLRLTREGKPVPIERYVSYAPNRRPSGHPIPRLKAPALTEELRAGATLVLDNVDELHRPVRRVAEALERLFRVHVQVNSYAGWRTSHGFDLHWDDHDVFVVQVAGRKHWKVYGMTRPYPLAKDVERADVPPEQVLWDGLLQDGDLLYIPRGWWHMAIPLDEPTLHLTVGVNNPTGADFMSWFAERLRESEIVRQDLPHLHGPEALQTYGENLREALISSFRPEMVAEYLASLDANARSRSGFSLPWAATESILPEAAEVYFRWISARPVAFDPSNNQVSITAAGRRWKFASAAAPVLKHLTSGQERTFHELVSAADGRLDADTIREFLKELVANGLVVVRSVAPSNES